MTKIMRGKRNIIRCVACTDDLLIGLYVGVWCGDGTQYYDNGYRIKICCHSKNLRMIAFFKSILLRLFDKRVLHVAQEIRHRSLIRFNSKFIYMFIHEYVTFGKNKTHTVCLLKEFVDYSDEFLSGFVLGLSLTDGYLKNKYIFNVTSENLARNLYDILNAWRLQPKFSVIDRTGLGWHNLHSVRLNADDTKILLRFLDKSLVKLSSQYTFMRLKYE